MSAILHINNSRENRQLQRLVEDHGYPVLINFHAKEEDLKFRLPFIEYKEEIVQDLSGVMNVLMQLHEGKDLDKIFEVAFDEKTKRPIRPSTSAEVKIKALLGYALGASWVYLLYIALPTISPLILSILVTIPAIFFMFPSLFGKIKDALEEMGTNMASNKNEKN